MVAEWWLKTFYVYAIHKKHWATGTQDSSRLQILTDKFPKISKLKTEPFGRNPMQWRLSEFATGSYRMPIKGCPQNPICSGIRLS